MDEYDALLSSTPFVALEAYAVWCAPCQAMSRIFALNADRLAVGGRYVFARFDIDSNRDVAAKVGARPLPAFFTFKNGEMVESVTGADPDRLEAVVQGLASRVIA